MALVELLQPTDMRTLAALAGGSSTREGTTYFSIIDSTTHDSYASVEGIDLAYDGSSDIQYGTVTTVVMDTADPDLIPNVLVRNLAYQPHGDINFGNDLHVNFAAALQIVMSGNDTVVGSAGFDYINGYDGNDVEHGAGGNDIMDGNRGNDTMFGDAGGDQLGGGLGRDILIGGPGPDNLCPYAFDGLGNDGVRDIVRFANLSDSGVTVAARDEVFGFISGPGIGADRIDLSLIDANPSLAGNQAFHLVTAFTAAKGEVRLAVSGNNTIIQVDGDNDIAVDMTILVHDAHLKGHDLIL